MVGEPVDAVHWGEARPLGLLDNLAQAQPEHASLAPPWAPGCRQRLEVVKGRAGPRRSATAARGPVVKTTGCSPIYQPVSTSSA